MHFEIRPTGRQPTMVLDREHDSTLLAVAGDGLRSFATSALDHFAEPRFCVLH
jgi:hypothetical protein